MTLSKYDKEDVCKGVLWQEKMQVRVERFLFVTQSKDWIIKCETSIKGRSVMQARVTICDCTRKRCFEDSSLLFLEWGNEIMLWGSRILYMLCIYVSLQDMYVIQERIIRKLLLEVQEFHYGWSYKPWVMHEEVHTLLCQTC
jgi:hypothetical protein